MGIYMETITIMDFLGLQWYNGNIMGIMGV
jgi:hypothetical protein